MKKVTVSAPALRELLQALNGPGHLIRELQMLRGPLVGKDNPINILVAEFNSSVDGIIHTDDIAVDRFAATMKAKLASARAKGQSGWDDPGHCTVEYLTGCLHSHVAKGDPVDVANFCMMLHQRGSEIAQQPQTQKCGLCGYSGTETDNIGQCPRCHWDELQPASPHVGATQEIWDAINVDLQQIVDDVSGWEGPNAERMRTQLEAAVKRLNGAVGHERAGYEAAIASSFEIDALRGRCEKQEHSLNTMQAKLTALEGQEHRAWINYKVTTDEHGNYAGTDVRSVDFTRLSYGYAWDKSEPLYAASGAAPMPFQQRVHPWLMACFGEEISADQPERNHRFLEEAVELVQACGCTQGESHQLVDYVYGRPAGEPYQEVGGVMVTLAALCLAHGLDMHTNGETELSRIWTKVEQIRAKQAAKPKHSPLPGYAPPAILSRKPLAQLIEEENARWLAEQEPS